MYPGTGYTGMESSLTEFKCAELDVRSSVFRCFQGDSMYMSSCFPLRTVRLKASVHLLGNHLPKSGIDLNQSGPAETNVLTVMDNKRELQEH